VPRASGASPRGVEAGAGRRGVREGTTGPPVPPHRVTLDRGRVTASRLAPAPGAPPPPSTPRSTRRIPRACAHRAAARRVLSGPQSVDVQSTDEVTPCAPI